MSAPTLMPAESLRPDERPVAHYRSISWSAVIAAILGLASVIVLVSPALCPVAIAGVIVAVLALNRIAAAEGQLIGRPAALTGLCLATLFLGWGFSGYFTRQWAVEENARRMADAWVQLVTAGKLREALQFRQSPAARIASPDALAEQYEKNQEAKNELAQFASEPLIKELAAQKELAQVRFEEVTRARRSGLTDHVTLKYTYERPAGQGRLRFWIQLSRQTDENTRRPEWQITSTQTLPPAGVDE